MARPKPAATKTPLVAQVRAAIRQADRGGVSQSDLARRAGMARSQLSRLMHGTATPAIDGLERLARALGKKIVLT